MRLELNGASDLHCAPMQMREQLQELREELGQLRQLLEKKASNCKKLHAVPVFGPYPKSTSVRV